jgi:hypothetical protein
MEKERRAAAGTRRGERRRGRGEKCGGGDWRARGERRRPEARLDRVWLVVAAVFPLLLIFLSSFY